MPKKNSGDLQDEHVHAWYQSGVICEERCRCGKVKVSIKEEERRVLEWENYRDLVKTTDASSDFQDMKKAFLAKDHQTMKAIDELVMTRNHEVVNEWGDATIERNDPESLLLRPNFPDPSTWGGYVI